MSLDVSTSVSFVSSVIPYTVPLLLGTLGEIMTERAGHLNLGVEGMMMMGGAFGYVAAVETNNPFLAMLIACIGAMLGALIYAVLTVTLRTNQTVSGLALTIFGVGFANTLGKRVENSANPEKIGDFFSYHPFELSGSHGVFIDSINQAFLSHDVFVYGSILLAIVIYLFLRKTKPGLNLRLTGENPAAAEASGVAVLRVKYTYILIGGALCGLAGYYIPSCIHRSWTSDIVNGTGWIVVSLVIFVRWDPIKAILGSFVFGALSYIGFTLQQSELFSQFAFFNQYVMGMFPYIVTILVLIITGAKKNAWNGPGSIGIPYFREER